MNLTDLPSHSVPAEKYVSLAEHAMQALSAAGIRLEYVLAIRALLDAGQNQTHTACKAHNIA